jgi:hypothetical protein
VSNPIYDASLSPDRAKPTKLLVGERAFEIEWEYLDPVQHYHHDEPGGWIAFAKVGSYRHRGVAGTPISAAATLAFELNARLHLGTDRFLIDLPISLTDLERLYRSSAR